MCQIGVRTVGRLALTTYAGSGNITALACHFSLAAETFETSSFTATLCCFAGGVDIAADLSDSQWKEFSSSRLG